MTPKELKNSILQLAIQGKLVEQRSEDGTGEELFQQIQAEKQHLIRAGKIKKEKPLPKITEEEKPFEIPEGWMWVRLGEIFQHNTGKALNASNKVGTYLQYITTSNLYWARFELDHLKEMFFTADEVQKCTVQKGDLLVCEGGDIGRAAIWPFDFEMRIQNHIHRLRSYSDDLDVEYYYYLFYLYKYAGWIGGKGIAIQGLSSNAIHRLAFPLPPLAEQKRIVAKIKELQPYIDRYEQAWNRLEAFNKRFPDDMKKSVLQLAIQGKLVEQRPEEGTGEELYREVQAEKLRLIRAGKIKKEKPLPEITEEEKPFDIPESWKWVRLGNCGSWSAGATPPRERLEYYDGAIPWLKTGDLNDGFIERIPESISEVALENTSVRLNPIGSVLMAMYGATIGKLGILSIAATTNQACCACVPYRGIYNKFLFFYLMAYRPTFIKMGEGGAQPNISKEKIVNSLFALPPLAEQKRIVSKLEELLPLCEKLK